MAVTDFALCFVIHYKTAKRQKAPDGQESSWGISQIRPFPDSDRSKLREGKSSAQQINNLAAPLSKAVCFS